jgi:hypothetical protein
MTSHSTNWKQHYSSLPSNDDGNKMCLSFSHAMAASRSQRDRILALTEETDSIIFVADEEGLITVIHSPKNLGGTRTRPSNKVIGLVGMGPLATPVVLNIEQAVATCEIRTLTWDSKPSLRPQGQRRMERLLWSLHGIKADVEFRKEDVPPLEHPRFLF